MNLRQHRIPDEIFDDLACGGGGPAAIDHLIAAQHSKHLLLLKLVVESAHTAGHRQAAQARRAYDLLAGIEQQDHAAAEMVLRHPPVGAWALHTIRALRDARAREQAVPAQLASVAIAAAVRAGADCSAEVPVRAGAVMLPSLGRIDVPDRADQETICLTVRNGRAAAVGRDWAVHVPADPAAESPGWQGLRTLSASAAGLELRILIEDLDASRMPGSANLGGRLSRREADRWLVTLRDAWYLLASHHRSSAAEIAPMIRVFTPLAPPVHGQVSATSTETFGAIAMSQPIDECSLAVTLVHEKQHAKLSALLDMTPMLLSDDGTRYYAPWRDDPRPLSGLLQGAYAFLGVAGFWRQQRSAADDGAAALWADSEFVRWRDASLAVVGTLIGSGRLTRAGAIFLAGMQATLNSWAAERVSPDAARQAARLADEHRARWLASNRGAEKSLEWSAYMGGGSKSKSSLLLSRNARVSG